MSEPNDPTAESLIAAALEVLAECGLRGATTRAIAERAGVNEVTLFRRFVSKNGLIEAAILSLYKSMRESAVRYTGDLQADLIHLARSIDAAHRAFGPLVRIILTEVPFDPDLSKVFNGSRLMLEAIGKMLRRYQRNGQLVAEPIGTLLPALIGPITMPYVLPDLGKVLGGKITTDPERHVAHFLKGRGMGKRPRRKRP